MHSLSKILIQQQCLVLTAIATAFISTSDAGEKVVQKFTPPYSTAIMHTAPGIPASVNRQLSRETHSIIRSKRLSLSYRSQPDAAIRTLHSAIEDSDSSLVRRAAIDICIQVGLKQSDAKSAAGYFVTAADLAFNGLSDNHASGEDKNQLLKLYNDSCGMAAEALVCMPRPFSAAPIRGPIKDYQIRQRTGGTEVLDIRLFGHLTPASNLEFRNIEAERITTSGVGAAMVAHYERKEERLRENPFLGLQGMMLPVNVCLEFPNDGQVLLSCRDLHIISEARNGGRIRTLSSDLSAPVAVLLSNISKHEVAWEGLVDPEDHEGKMGLIQFEPHRPDQIPVIFVHGLVSSPAIWFDALNELRKDPLIRRKF